VLEVTEPQVWMLIGVFATAVLGMITLTATMFVRVVNAGFAAMNAKLDHLDRDVQAIARRVFPEHE
jgi:hypothetical protein